MICIGIQLTNAIHKTVNISPAPRIATGQCFFTDIMRGSSDAAAIPSSLAGDILC